MQHSNDAWHIDDELVKERLGEVASDEPPQTVHGFRRVLRAYLESYISEDLIDIDEDDWQTLGRDAYHSATDPRELIETAKAAVERIQSDKNDRFRQYNIDEQIQRYGHSVVTELAATVDPVTPDELREQFTET